MTFQIVEPGKRLLDGDAINALANQTNLAILSPLTALAGGGRTGATQLNPARHPNGTAATAADSVLLPSATLANAQGGLTCFVANDGAADVTVYAQGSDTINGTAGATGVTLTAGTSAIFFCAQSGKWDGNNSGGNASGSGSFATLTVGTLTATGAAGSGAAETLTGGTGTATGVGGAINLTGGAGGSTSGTGGAVNLTGGAGGAGNASGGSVVLTPGAPNGSGNTGGVRVEGRLIRTQAAPTAATVSATLTAAQLLAGMVTVNQGGAGASALQVPTGTAIQNALPTDFGTNDSFDVSLINISAVAAEVASFTVNTDVTIVGSAAVDAIAAGTWSSGLFRFRKTADHVFVAYRIA